MLTKLIIALVMQGGRIVQEFRPQAPPQVVSEAVDEA